MKQAIFFPEMLEEQTTETDLFKPELSKELTALWSMSRELKHLTSRLEHFLFFTKYGIVARTEKEGVSIQEDLKDSLSYDWEFALNSCFDRFEQLKKLLQFEGKKF